MRIALLALVALVGCSTPAAGLIHSDGGGDAGFDAGSDPRCSTANCEVLLTCGLDLSGAPSPGACYALEFDAGWAVMHTLTVQYCVEACQADSAGGLVECVIQYADACADAGMNFREVAQNIVLACTPDAGPSDAGAACITQCDQARGPCEDACAFDGGLDSCLSCSYDCEQAAEQCFNACPP